MTTSPTEAPTFPPPLGTGVPVREIGFAADQSAGEWWGSLSEEKAPELRWPQAYDVYDDMMRNSQISSVIRAVMMPILGTTWRIDGKGCLPEITRHVAADLGLPIVGEGDDVDDRDVEDRFSWGEHLELHLEEKFTYGHSVGEQKAYFGPDGRWHLAKIGYRPPRSITKWNVAADGGLISIEQTGAPAGMLTANSKPRRLSIDRLVIHVRGRRGGNWRGRSLLRTAYQPWLLNQRAARVEMITAERQGSPLVVYVGAPGETDLEPGKLIATRVRAGQEAGAAIPHGAELLQKGVEGALPDINQIKRYNDDQIARSVLAHFLNLGSQGNQSSSYALGATFSDFFTLSLRAEANDVARTGSRYIARDIVAWNWPGERAPRVIYDEIGGGQAALVQAIATLVGAGVLKPDEDLERFTRTALGLPPRGSAPITAPQGGAA